MTQLAIFISAMHNFAYRGAQITHKRHLLLNQFLCVSLCVRVCPCVCASFLFTLDLILSVPHSYISVSVLVSLTNFLQFCFWFSLINYILPSVPFEFPLFSSLVLPYFYCFFFSLSHFLKFCLALPCLMMYVSMYPLQFC